MTNAEKPVFAWLSWRASGVSYPGPWTRNHLSVDGKTTLCGRIVPVDAFDVEYAHHSAHDDCLKCQHAQKMVSLISHLRGSTLDELQSRMVSDDIVD